VCLHPVVLIVSLLLLLPALGGIQHVVTAGLFTPLPLDVLLRTWNDDYVKTSYDTAMLKLHPPRRPAVYIMGGSSVREAFTTERNVERKIAAAGGGPASVHVLSSVRQNLGESFAIVDNLPPSERAICVIGVNFERFVYDPPTVEAQLGGRQLLLDSPGLRGYVFARYHRGLTTPTILPGIMDYVSGWFEKHRSELLRGRLPRVRYVLHRVYQGHPWSNGSKRAAVARLVREQVAPGAGFDRNSRYNLALLDEIVKAAQAKGFTVVLLELPSNRAFVRHSFDRVLRIYRPAIAQLARRRGIEYLRSPSRQAFVDADFRDLTHLVESGRAKYEAAFVRALVPLLRRVESQTGS
jgi:hypothetical protein